MMKMLVDGLTRILHEPMTSREAGDIIRHGRRERGLRQDQLAAVANVGVRFQIETERGKPTAQIGKVLAVLTALGCKVSIQPPASPSA
jgi:transcriptional regulator with XRE-family HTH domain